MVLFIIFISSSLLLYQSRQTLPLPFLSSVLFVSYKANMGVITYSQEITSVVTPSRLFKAMFLDSHHILPKIVPGGIKSIEFIKGDGGVGSIKQTNFGESKSDHTHISTMSSIYRDLEIKN